MAPDVYFYNINYRNNLFTASKRIKLLTFIVINSREYRYEVNKKVKEEMSKSFKENSDFLMPTDMKKMAYEGFDVTVEG